MSASRHRTGVALALLAVLTTSAAAKEAAQAASLLPASAAHVAAAPSLASAPALSSLSAAVVVPPPAKSTAADELTRLQDETVVLQAKLKQLEAQQAVDARLQALRGTAQPSLGNIRIVAVEGIGANRIATVRLSDGNEFEAAPGDTIVDGVRVTAIERGAVVVRLRNGRLMRLRAGSSDNEAEMQTNSANALGGAAMAPRFQGRPE